MSLFDQIRKQEKYFYTLGEKVVNALESEEHLTISFSGEETQFYRFNKSKLRQATNVSQNSIELDFIKNKRSISKSLNLSFNESTDLNMCLELLKECRLDADNLPESQSIVLPQAGTDSCQIIETAAASNIDVTAEVLTPLQDVDMAGIFVTGPVSEGVYNSKGLKHWFTSNSFYFDYSLYSAKQKAVKNCYAGSNWETKKYLANIETSKKLLEKMDLPVVDVKPGAHRTYLAPGAVSEILSTMSWGSLSMAAFKQGYCAFAKLKEGKEKLSPKLSLQENFELGLSPKFNSLGEVSENKLNIIENGELKTLLVSSESAAEFEVPSNQANNHEMLRSPVIKPGSLSHEDILKELGTGLYLSNLHYLNWSDRMSAKITGMTRFACFWVEDGEIVGPIKDLRFDESLYNCFGSELSDFTKESEINPNTMTYDRRYIGGSSTPGALINKFNFTL